MMSFRTSNFTTSSAASMTLCSWWTLPFANKLSRLLSSSAYLASRAFTKSSWRASNTAASSSFMQISISASFSRNWRIISLFNIKLCLRFSFSTRSSSRSEWNLSCAADSKSSVSVSNFFLSSSRFIADLILRISDSFSEASIMNFWSASRLSFIATSFTSFSFAHFSFIAATFIAFSFVFCTFARRAASFWRRAVSDGVWGVRGGSRFCLFPGEVIQVEPCCEGGRGRLNDPLSHDAPSSKFDTSISPSIFVTDRRATAPTETVT